jgi:serine protease Do
VVQTADKVAVQLQDGRSFMARVVASSPRADVALLKMESPPADLVAARLGNSDSLLTGDQIAVVGAPYGLSYTFTVGHVSGRHRVKETISGIPMEFIQTDASINQGNSGGPMFNLSGEVVGVVSYILSQSGGFEGLGFAVSSNVAEKLLITTGGSFWTGVEGFFLTGELARALNLPQPAGILIQRVAEGSPGAALGLRPGTVVATIQDQKLLLGGDIVLEIGSIKVAEEAGIEDRIEQYLRSVGPGRPLNVKVLRGGSITTLTAARAR